jgi:hypothetical protein
MCGKFGKRGGLAVILTARKTHAIRLTESLPILFYIWAHPRLRRGPGYPLQSFCRAAAKSISTPIPCAAKKWPPCHFLALGFCPAKT